MTESLDDGVKRRPGAYFINCDKSDSNYNHNPPKKLSLKFKVSFGSGVFTVSDVMITVFSDNAPTFSSIQIYCLKHK